MVRWSYWSRRALVFSLRHSRFTGALLFIFFALWRSLRLDFNDKIWRVHPMLGTMMDREVYRSRRLISNMPAVMSWDAIKHGLGYEPVVSDEVWRGLLDFSFHSWNFCASTIRLLWTLSRCVYQFADAIYPVVRPVLIAFWSLPLLTKVYCLALLTLSCVTATLWRKGYLQRAGARLRVWHMRVADAVANYGPYILFLSFVHFPLKQALSLPHFRVLHQNLLFFVAISYSLITSIGIVILRRFQEMRVACGIIEPPRSADGSLTRRTELARRQIHKLPPGTDLSRPPTGVVVASTVLGMTTPRGLTSAVTGAAKVAPLEVRKTVLRQAVVHILTFWAILTLYHALMVIPEKMVEVLLREPLPVFSLWSIGSGYTDRVRRLILTPTAVLGYEDIIYLKAPRDNIPNGLVTGMIAPRLAWILLTCHEIVTTVLVLSVLLQHDRFGDWIRRFAVDFLEYVVFRLGGLKVVLVNRVRRTKERQIEKDIIFGDTDSPYAGYLSSKAGGVSSGAHSDDEGEYSRSVPAFPTKDGPQVPNIPLFDIQEGAYYPTPITRATSDQSQPWLGRLLDFFRSLGGRHVERFLFLFGFLPIQKLKEIVIHAAPLCFLLTPSFICRPAFLIIALFVPMLYGLKGLYRRALEKAVYWQTYYTALMLFIAGLDILANSSPLAAWLVFALRPKFAAVLLLLWICTEPDVLGVFVVSTASRVSKHGVQVALSARRTTTQPPSDSNRLEQENFPSHSAPPIMPTSELSSLDALKLKLAEKEKQHQCDQAATRSFVLPEPQLTPIEDQNEELFAAQMVPIGEQPQPAEPPSTSSVDDNGFDINGIHPSASQSTQDPQKPKQAEGTERPRRAGRSRVPATESAGEAAEPTSLHEGVEAKGEAPRRASRRKGTDVSATSTATITSRRESSLSGSTSGLKKRSQPKTSNRRELRSHSRQSATPPTAVA